MQHSTQHTVSHNAMPFTGTSISSVIIKLEVNSAISFLIKFLIGLIKVKTF